MAKKNETPTAAQFGNYQRLYDYYNKALWGGKLPNCILNFSRHARSLGFFVAKVWARAGGDERACEISLNPDHLGRDTRDAHSTLVHEMAHLWQHYFGKEPRRCYHDWQFANEMERVGLMTSHNGQEGGKRVGQSMTHYVVAGGEFDRAFAAIPAELLLPWRTVASLDAGNGKEKKEKPKSKFAYQCPGCECKAWGKAGLNLVCGECDEALVMEE